MILRFVSLKCSLMVFALFISVSLCAMGEEHEVQEFYYGKAKPALELPDTGFITTTKQTISDTWNKIKKTVENVTNDNADETPEQEKAVENTLETAPASFEGSQISAEVSVTTTASTTSSSVSTENTSIKVHAWSSKELMLLSGGTALAAVVIGGVTYILYKNGKLARIGKTLKDHSLITAASASALCGLLLAYVATNFYF